MEPQKDPEVFLPKEGQEEIPPTARQDSVIYELDKQPTQSRMPKMCSTSSHPIIALLHILFQGGIIFLYLALPLVTSQINQNALLIVAGAIDFYFIKNIVGRKLIGMRWEIEVTDDGREQFRFQSKIDQRAIPISSQTAFWYPLYIFEIVWIVFLVLSVLAWFWPHIFMTLYQFIILRYNHKHFSECFKTRGLHVQKLINQHGPDTLLKYHRGTITSRIDTDPREKQ